MNQLKLKYILELVSNIGQKSQVDAKLMEDAQAKIKKAVDSTGQQIDKQGIAITKVTKTATDGSRLQEEAQRKIREATTGSVDKMEALDRALSRVGSNTSIERHVGYMNRLAQSVEGAQRRAVSLRQALGSGLAALPEVAGQVGGAYYGGKKVMAPAITAYSSLESATTDLQIALMRQGGKVDSNYGDIQKKAVELGNKLPGSTKDFVGSATTLLGLAVPAKDITKAMEASANLGVVLHMDQGSSASTVAKLREAYGLKGDEIPGVADDAQRHRFAFGMAPGDLLMAAKYSASTLGLLGLGGTKNMSEILTLQGMANLKGMDGGQFGTNFDMMLSRLSAGPQMVEEATKGRKGAAGEFLEQSGIKFNFYDAKGQLKEEDGSRVKGMLRELEKLQMIKEKYGDKNALDVAGAIFGTEAARPALIMAQAGVKGFDEARESVKGQASLDDRINMSLGTFANKLEALGGTIENVMAAIGKHTGESSKPLMDKANDIVGGPVQEFFDAHPKTGTAALVGAGGVSAWLTSKFGLSAARALISGGAAAGEVGAAGAGTVGAGMLAAAGVGAAGLFAGWQVAQLGGALSDLYGIKNRQGVTLSEHAKGTRLTDAAVDRVIGPHLGAQGMPDILSLTAPNTAAQSLKPGDKAEVKIGEGKLDVNVRITDERTTATSTITQPMSLIRINPGNTNPAGYAIGGPR